MTSPSGTRLSSDWACLDVCFEVDVIENILVGILYGF